MANLVEFTMSKGVEILLLLALCPQNVFYMLPDLLVGPFKQCVGKDKFVHGSPS